MYFLNSLENLGPDYQLFLDEIPLQLKSNSNSYNLSFLSLSSVV